MLRPALIWAAQGANLIFIIVPSRTADIELPPPLARMGPSSCM